MKKGLAKLILISAIAFGLASCHTKKSLPEELIRTTPEKVDTLRAIDNSKVLVIPKSTGSFNFYRDTNNDGYADTKGEGFYMLGLSEILEEDSIRYEKVNIDSLYKKLEDKLE